MCSELLDQWNSIRLLMSAWLQASLSWEWHRVRFFSPKRSDQLRFGNDLLLFAHHIFKVLINWWSTIFTLAWLIKAFLSSFPGLLNIRKAHFNWLYYCLMLLYWRHQVWDQYETPTSSRNPASVCPVTPRTFVSTLWCGIFSISPSPTPPMLTGAELLAKVKELGDVCKSDLVRACG